MRCLCVVYSYFKFQETVERHIPNRSLFLEVERLTF